MKRVTCAEAARVLGVNRSTVTRWAKKHPALLDDDNRVSIDEVRAHRDETINPALQTRAATGAESGAPAAPVTEPAAQALAAGNGTPLNNSRARSEAAKADEAELNLAERLGNTLNRVHVEHVLAEAVEKMRQRANQLVRDACEDIARTEDVRAVEHKLEEMMHDLMTQAARDFTDHGGHNDDAAAA